mgnify:CR=1 FL=1
MKSLKALLALALFLVLIIPAPLHANAEETVAIHFFYDEICTHCQEAGIFLETLERDFTNIVIHRYDVGKDPEAVALFGEVRAVFDKRMALTPFIVIGGAALVGFGPQTEADIINLIGRYTAEAHVDVVRKLIDGIAVLPEDIESVRFAPGDYVKLPLIGEVPIDELSLFVGAVVIGFVDGFNPCAMWILLFLITMLFNMKNKARMWLLGLTFLMTSAFVYFLIMAAWLNVALTIAGITWIRILIGVFALGFGLTAVIRHLLRARTEADGCEVADGGQRRKIMDRIRALVSEKSLPLALLGIIILAISVNLLELACSAGLPLLYTQILAYNELPISLYYLYILVYGFFFLIDDLAVFFIAMFTLRLTGISARYARISHLVGASIMLIIGFLLIFFPQIIMFS